MSILLDIFIKGFIGLVPFGSFLNAGIDGVENYFNDKEQEEAFLLLENKINNVYDDLLENLDDEKHFSVMLQKCYKGVQNCYQEDKKQFFANALKNSVSPIISKDKCTYFIDLLDRYTFSHIKVLAHFNKTHENSSKNGNIKVLIEGSHHMIDYLSKALPEFQNDQQFLTHICDTLSTDGLIKKVDWRETQAPSVLSKKTTTSIGEEFIKFISE